MSYTQSGPYDPLVAEAQELLEPAKVAIQLANSIDFIVDETDGCIYVEKRSDELIPH